MLSSVSEWPSPRRTNKRNLTTILVSFDFNIIVIILLLVLHILNMTRFVDGFLQAKFDRGNAYELPWF